MPDTWAMIDKQIKALGKWYSQVDKTRDRLKLTAHELKDYPDNRGIRVPLDKARNVRENRSYSYMSRIIAGLMGIKWQGVVEGNISKREAHKVELFAEACFQQADEYLFNEYEITSLDDWVANHLCHTGVIGVLWIVKAEDGEYKVHCLPCDMRNTPYVPNKWIASITFLGKEALEQEIDKCEERAINDKLKFERPVNLDDEKNEIRDYWDGKKNEFWVNKVQVFEQPHPYGRLPFIQGHVPGFMFRDEGYMEYESPTLLFANESLYDQLSDQLSIDATLGFNAMRPGYEAEREGITQDQPSSVPAGPGESLDVPPGGRHLPVPTPDINRAELASRDQVNRLIDEAAPMQPRAYNTPPSAIEVATEVELLDQLQNPRIKVWQMFKSQLARLNIEQTILMAGHGELKTGSMGRQTRLSVADLKDPKRYTITYQLQKQNKRLAIVNEARALAAWGKFPLQYILRDIVGAEDPDGWLREIELERAKSANPAIGLLEMAVRYAEEAEDLEEGADRDLKNWQSIMLQHEYVMLMRQRLQPVPQGEAQNLREATKETGNAQGLISLLGERQPAQLAGVQKGVTIGS